jgi:hypothetical protein
MSALSRGVCRHLANRPRPPPLTDAVEKGLEEPSEQ